MILLGSILLVAFGVVPETWRVPFLVAAATLETAETLFWVWLSQRRPPIVGNDALVGEHAVVVQPCHPVGQVRLHGEIWRARCETVAERGETVRVRAVHGLSLLVERRS